MGKEPLGWHLQFALIPKARSLPKEERADCVREHFQQCLQRVSDQLMGIQIIKHNELMLSLSLKGPDEACEQLRDFVSENKIGKMYRNKLVTRSAVGDDLHQSYYSNSNGN